MSDTYLLADDSSIEILEEKTVALLSTLPDSTDDDALCNLLSTEFEGLYYFAEADDETWDSTKESYAQFTDRATEPPNTLITTEPYPASAHIYCWLLQQVPEHV